MGLLSALLGNADQTDTVKVEAQLGAVLLPNEQVIFST